MWKENLLFFLEAPFASELLPPAVAWGLALLPLPLGPQNAPGEQVLEFEWTYHEESGIAVGVAPASAVDDAAHELVVAAPAGGGSVEHDAAGDEAGTLLAALAAQVGAIAASNMEASDEPDWI